MAAKLIWRVGVAVLAKIYEIIAGSHAYGTNLPDSDLDIRSITIGSLSFYLDPFRRTEVSVQHQEEDSETYDLDKFIRLAADCNPNVLEWLWVPESCIKFISGAGIVLQKNRDFFLSQKVRQTFSGYAHAQLHRLKNHKAWIDNPPSRPERSDFGLPVNPLFSKNMTKFLASLSTDQTDEVIPREKRRQVDAELRHWSALAHWQKYQEWFRNRNPERFKLEQKCGMDGKHGSHLVRLLEEGIEILLHQTLTLPRPNAKMLKEIRLGNWSYDQLMAYVEPLQDKFLEAALVAEESGILPWTTDKKKLTELAIRLKELTWDSNLC